MNETREEQPKSEAFARVAKAAIGRGRAARRRHGGVLMPTTTMTDFAVQSADGTRLTCSGLPFLPPAWDAALREWLDSVDLTPEEVLCEEVVRHGSALSLAVRSDSLRDIERRHRITHMSVTEPPTGRRFTARITIDLGREVPPFPDVIPIDSECCPTCGRED